MAKRPRWTRICLERLPALRERPAATQASLAAHFVPELSASEHCIDCSAPDRTKTKRMLYRIVDGKTGPVPEPPMHLGSHTSNRVRRDPATRPRGVSPTYVPALTF